VDKVAGAVRPAEVAVFFAALGTGDVGVDHVEVERVADEGIVMAKILDEAVGVTVVCVSDKYLPAARRSGPPSRSFDW
jgi:hypothetical protein